jgi:hypothetical protein
MNIPSIHSRRGQTLIEALIALSILTVGFLGVITLLTKSFQLNRTTADDTQATYLAAEGIEIVKNLIDKDVYTGLPNNNDFGACFPLSGYYYPIDYETTVCSKLDFEPPSAPPAPTPLYFNSKTDFYTDNSFNASPTDFVRTIEITDDPGASGLVDTRVQSTVTWTNGDLSNTITLEDIFYNWHP